MVTDFRLVLPQPRRQYWAYGFCQVVFRAFLSYSMSVIDSLRKMNWQSLKYPPSPQSAALKELNDADCTQIKLATILPQPLHVFIHYGGYLKMLASYLRKKSLNFKTKWPLDVGIYSKSFSLVNGTD